MSVLRSEGWSVRPSMVMGGASSPVTLVVDDETLTQIVGIHPETFETPWAVVGDLVLTRRGSRVTLSARVGESDRRWSRRGLEDFEEWREVVLAHGGVVRRRPARVGVVVAAAAVVVVASLGGVLAAVLGGRPNPVLERRDARSANLTLADLPAGWGTTTGGYLSYLVPPAGEVITSTPSTVAGTDVVGDAVATTFQRCLGVSNATDRVFGDAGQFPDYQVSSPVFHVATPLETEVATTSQYYRTTGMVARDVAEMSRSGFGACFAQANATALLYNYASDTTPPAGARSWTPVTYAHGWARGGVVPVDLPGVEGNYSLAVVVVATGHFEVTLSALVPSWPSAQPLLDRLVGVLKSRLAGASAA